MHAENENWLGYFDRLLGAGLNYVVSHPRECVWQNENEKKWEFFPWNKFLTKGHTHTHNSLNCSCSEYVTQNTTHHHVEPTGLTRQSERQLQNNIRTTESLSIADRRGHQGLGESSFLELARLKSAKVNPSGSYLSAPQWQFTSRMLFSIFLRAVTFFLWKSVFHVLQNESSKIHNECILERFMENTTHLFFRSIVRLHEMLALSSFSVVLKFHQKGAKRFFFCSDELSCLILLEQVMSKKGREVFRPFQTN